MTNGHSKKLNVLTVVGTRPEIIRLSRIISKLDRYCEHTLVHTGQNYDYELNEIFFEELGIKPPKYFLNTAGDNATETIGNVIIETGRLLSKIKPDCMLVLGDTNSCMSILPAKRNKIPTFHLEAGNRCFDQRVPEEINRKIVDHIADVNLTYSSIATEHLMSEGLTRDRVLTLGSPMYEVLKYYRADIAKSNILEKLSLIEGEFFLVSCHREENLEITANFQNIVYSLNRLAETYDFPIIISTHPRTRKKFLEEEVVFHERVLQLKPLGFFDYNRLQTTAKAVLSDSGTINEEASILNFPALNLRETHERPEAMEKATTIMVGLNPDRIDQGLRILEQQANEKGRSLETVPEYNFDNVSEKVLRTLHSYTDYINRSTWKNY